jgi:hypothetical protein
LISRKAAYTADFLDGALSAIVLAAAGEKMPAEFVTLVVGGDDDGVTLTKYTRGIRPPAQAEALAYLALLAVDLLSGSNDYFLPIEAIEKLLKIEVLTDASICDAVCAIRDKESQKCKSDYGPVRNARDFRVPLEEIRQRIIPRRYGPLIDIFAREKGRKPRVRN